MPHLVRKSTNEDREVRNKRCARRHIAPEYAPRLHLRERAPRTRAFFRIPGDGEVVGVELCGGLSRTCRGGVDNIGVDVGLVRGQLVARKSFPFCQPWALQGFVAFGRVRHITQVTDALMHSRRLVLHIAWTRCQPARTHPHPHPQTKHKQHRQWKGLRGKGGEAQPWPRHQRQKSESA